MLFGIEGLPWIHSILQTTYPDALDGRPSRRRENYYAWPLQTIAYVSANSWCL